LKLSLALIRNEIKRTRATLDNLNRLALSLNLKLTMKSNFDLWKIVDAKAALKAQSEGRIARERQSRKLAKLEEGVGFLVERNNASILNKKVNREEFRPIPIVRAISSPDRNKNYTVPNNYCVVDSGSNNINVDKNIKSYSNEGTWLMNCKSYAVPEVSHVVPNSSSFINSFNGSSTCINGLNAINSNSNCVGGSNSNCAEGSSTFINGLNSTNYAGDSNSN